MTYPFGGVSRVPRRKQVTAAFIDSSGISTQQEVTLAPQNVSGQPYIELPEGQVLAYNRGKQLWMPMGLDAVGTGGVTAANLIPVANDVHQFIPLDYVFIGGGTGYRQILSVDHDNSTITIAGAPVTLAEGVELRLDAFKWFAISQTTGTVTSMVVNDAAGFEAGRTVQIGANAGVAVSDVDYETNTLTIASTAVTAGDVVISEGDDEYYKVTTQTIRLVDLDRGYSGPNPSVPTRDRGEVREFALTGLTAAAKTFLRNERDIIFNNTQW